MEIKKAFVHYKNDPSVGMFPYGFELEIHLNNPDLDELNEIRKSISNLYELSEGEKPSSILFDVEIEAQNKCEAEADRQREEWEKEMDIQRDRETAIDALIDIEKGMDLDRDYFERANQRAIRSMI